MIPLYSYNEKHHIDESIFISAFGFVPVNDEARHGCTVAFIVLTILFIILGVVDIAFYFMKIKPTEKLSMHSRGNNSTVSLESNHDKE